ncbi:large subunit ribosomal protein L17 [Desulfobaculum xiamenense]|uniref:50S ribosomal protein L17 n=1 Tax=Desulfobaculum xiamenense TaxID=995050 RepID=A0A846QF97_9BACT|nr:bL17 family ribosomal protein [Desulfobaculum xiamenense]NJB67456.1 large subunit ribosomal protein L17 [Desulfobaculum xiamenense]
MERKDVLSGPGIGREFLSRYAGYRPMVKLLMTHGKIRTTEEKAAHLRFVVDRLVSLAVENSDASRRQAYRFLNDNRILMRLFDTIGPCCSEEGGSYVRLNPIGGSGSASTMTMVELPTIVK